MKQRLTSRTSGYLRHVHSVMQHVTLTSMILIATMFAVARLFAQADPLPSWNDTAAKKAIIDFVGRITKKGAD